MCKWVELEKEEPTGDALYLICAQNMVSDKPLIAIAWHDPDSGWGPQLPPMWLDAITHWQEIKQPDESVCRWELDGDGIWETECGNTFQFSDSAPHDNRLKFCPCCGCSLQECHLDLLTSPVSW